MKLFKSIMTLATAALFAACQTDIDTPQIGNSADFVAPVLGACGDVIVNADNADSENVIFSWTAADFGLPVQVLYQIYLVRGDVEALAGATNSTSLAIPKGDLNGVVINGLGVSANDILNAVTPRTKVILINSPCNPSGQIYSEEFIRTVVEFAEQKNIFLVMDDIYHQLVFDGKKTPNPCAYAKEAKNLVIINGVSKLYGLTGLRIGWAVCANNELIGAMGRIQAQSTSCNGDLSEVGAAAALKGDQSVVADLCRVLQQNRDVLLAEAAKIPHVRVEKPAGTFYSFMDFSHYNADSSALAQYLLEKALVAVVPGVSFGAEGYLRISYCADQASIIEGMRRIRWALDKNAPKEMKIGDKLLTRD